MRCLQIARLYKKSILLGLITIAVCSLQVADNDKATHMMIGWDPKMKALGCITCRVFRDEAAVRI